MAKKSPKNTTFTGKVKKKAQVGINNLTGQGLDITPISSGILDPIGPIRTYTPQQRAEMEKFANMSPQEKQRYKDAYSVFATPPSPLRNIPAIQTDQMGGLPNPQLGQDQTLAQGEIQTTFPQSIQQAQNLNQTTEDVEVSRRKLRNPFENVKFNDYLDATTIGLFGVNALLNKNQAIEDRENYEKRLRNVFTQKPIDDYNYRYAPGSFGGSQYQTLIKNFGQEGMIMAKNGANIRRTASPNFGDVEVEGGEFIQLPDLSTQHVQGPSHANGGVHTSLPEGARVFSDHLKPKGSKKTYAQLAKKYDIEKYQKILDNPYAGGPDRRTAELMLRRNQSILNELFADQQIQNGNSDGTDQAEVMAKFGLDLRKGESLSFTDPFQYGGQYLGGTSQFGYGGYFVDGGMFPWDSTFYNGTSGDTSVLTTGTDVMGSASFQMGGYTAEEGDEQVEMEAQARLKAQEDAAINEGAPVSTNPDAYADDASFGQNYISDLTTGFPPTTPTQIPQLNPMVNQEAIAAAIDQDMPLTAPRQEQEQQEEEGPMTFQEFKQTQPRNLSNPKLQKLYKDYIAGIYQIETKQDEEEDVETEEVNTGEGSPTVEFRRGGYFADGGKNNPDDAWIKKILEYEAKKGSVTGKGLENFGYNNWKKLGHSKPPANLAEAVEYFKQDYLPQVEKYPLGVRERIADYIYNTGRSPEDLLLYTAGKISLSDINSSKTFNKEWEKHGSEIQKMLQDPSFIKNLDAKKTDVYKTTKGGTLSNPNPAYNATWKDRISMWGDPTKQAAQTTAPAAPVNAPRTNIAPTPVSTPFNTSANNVVPTNTPTTAATNTPAAPVTRGESKGLKRAQQIVEAYKRDPDYKFDAKDLPLIKAELIKALGEWGIDTEENKKAIEKVNSLGGFTTVAEKLQNKVYESDPEVAVDYGIKEASTLQGLQFLANPNKISDAELDKITGGNKALKNKIKTAQRGSYGSFTPQEISTISEGVKTLPKEKQTEYGKTNFMDKAWFFRRPIIKEVEFDNKEEYDNYVKQINVGGKYVGQEGDKRGLYIKPIYKGKDPEGDTPKKDPVPVNTPQGSQFVTPKAMKQMPSTPGNFAAYQAIPEAMGYLSGLRPYTYFTPDYTHTEIVPPQLNIDPELQSIDDSLQSTIRQSTGNASIDASRRTALFGQALAAKQQAFGRKQNYDAQAKFQADQYNAQARDLESYRDVTSAANIYNEYMAAAQDAAERERLNAITNVVAKKAQHDADEYRKMMYFTTMYPQYYYDGTDRRNPIKFNPYAQEFYSQTANMYPNQVPLDQATQAVPVSQSTPATPAAPRTTTPSTEASPVSVVQTPQGPQIMSNTPSNWGQPEMNQNIAYPNFGPTYNVAGYPSVDPDVAAPVIVPDYIDYGIETPEMTNPNNFYNLGEDKGELMFGGRIPKSTKKGKSPKISNIYKKYKK